MAKESINTVYGHFLVRVDQEEIDRRAVEATRIEMEMEAAKEAEKGAIIPESEQVGKKPGINSLVISELSDAPTELVYAAHEDSQVKAGDKVVIRDNVPPVHVKYGDFIYMMYSDKAVLMVISDK